MLLHFHTRLVRRALHGNSIISINRCKTTQELNYIPDSENFDLSYASYESTRSYTKTNPEPSPLIILHGLMSSKNNWNTFCKRLHFNNKNKIIALDARNHGESPHSEYHSYDNLVIDLKQFMEKTGLKTIKLLGHSMGGRTAMLFALKYPEAVEKLIVVDVSPFSTSSSMRQIPNLLQNLEKLELPQNISIAQARKLIAENLVRIVKNRGLITFLMTNLIKKSGGNLGWRFHIKAILNNFDYIASFPEIHNLTYTGPVLFLGGSKSDHIQKSDFSKILTLFPNAELKYIEGAGHWLQTEKPDEFLKITSNFLNTVVS